MRGLEWVFNDAREDEFAGDLDDSYVEARIVFGVKIVRDRGTGEIEILNTTKGGDYYEEISKKEYDNFYIKGWRYGVYIVSLSNYRRKLDLINDKIQDLIGKSARKKDIDSLQERRKNIMQRYTKVSKKLNLLN
jgi:hypothetical protein